MVPLSKDLSNSSVAAARCFLSKGVARGCPLAGAWLAPPCGELPPDEGIDGLRHLYRQNCKFEGFLKGYLFYFIWINKQLYNIVHTNDISR